MTNFANTAKLLLASLALGAAISCGGGDVWGESWGWEGVNSSGDDPNQGGIVAPVSPIRNQNPYGTCWAFSAMASLESNWMKSNPNSSKDLSEWHLAWFAYNPVNGTDSMPAFTKSPPASGEDSTFDQGGNVGRATAILSRGTGPVDEVSAPYQNRKPYPQSSIPTGNEPRVLGIKDVMMYDRLAKEDIKSMVRTYGALAMSMYWDDNRYYGTSNAFRYVQSGTSISTNHGVDIVGWDDNFDKSKFPAGNRPSANGAWIVRNSWGPTWGDNGYFYMSYDTSLRGFASYIPDSLPAGQKIYQYDTLGLVNTVGYTSSATPDTAWFSNIFTATRNESVKAVAFWSSTAGAQYEITIKSGVTGNPSTGTQVHGPQTGTLSHPGYHQIALTSPVSVATGTKFAVVVKLKEQGYNYPIGVTYVYQGYSDAWTATPGVGFISSSGTSWTDAASASPSRGVCLKAFTTQ